MEKPTVTARAAYFRPVSHKVKKIYGKNWAEYQVEASLSFRKNWKATIGCGFTENSGHSLGVRDKTKLRMIPLTLGVQRLFNLRSSLDAYVGLGASYGILHIKDYSRYVHKNTHKCAFGGVVQTGLTYHFTNHISVGGFVEYSLLRFHMSGHRSHPYVKRKSVDMSGMKVGGSINFTF